MSNSNKIWGDFKEVSEDEFDSFLGNYDGTLNHHAVIQGNFIAFLDYDMKTRHKSGSFEYFSDQTVAIERIPDGYGNNKKRKYEIKNLFVKGAHV